MTAKQLDFDCRRLKPGGHEMSRTDAYCKRQRIQHNASLNNGQYGYYRYIEENFKLFFFIN